MVKFIPKLGELPPPNPKITFKVPAPIPSSLLTRDFVAHHVIRNDNFLVVNSETSGVCVLAPYHAKAICLVESNFDTNKIVSYQMSSLMQHYDRDHGKPYRGTSKDEQCRHLLSADDDKEAPNQRNEDFAKLVVGLKKAKHTSTKSTMDKETFELCARMLNIKISEDLSDEEEEESESITSLPDSKPAAAAAAVVVETTTTCSTTTTTHKKKPAKKEMHKKPPAKKSQKKKGKNAAGKAANNMGTKHAAAIGADGAHHPTTKRSMALVAKQVQHAFLQG